MNFIKAIDRLEQNPEMFDKIYWIKDLDIENWQTVKISTGKEGFWVSNIRIYKKYIFWEVANNLIIENYCLGQTIKFKKENVLQIL